MFEVEKYQKNYNKKIEIKITFEEYKKIREYFPYYFQKLLIVISAIIIVLSLATLVSPDRLSIGALILMDVSFIISTFMILKIIDIFLRKHSYKKLTTKSLDNINYTLYFYDDYFIKATESIIQKIKYSSIWKNKETNSNIYLLIDKNNIIPIQKTNSNNETIEYIKNTIITKNTNKKSKKFRSTKNNLVKDNIHNPKIENFLTLLFVFSIASIWIGLYLLAIIIEFFHIPLPLAFKYGWIVLIVLPIPILSIVLGIIYKRKNIKCTKNIVAGCIVSIVLFFISAFSLLFNFYFKTDYDNVHSYQKIINVNIPNKGIFYKIKWDSSYLLEHTSNYIRFTNKQDAKDFYNNIKNNEIWSLKNNISSNLNILIPTSLLCQAEDDQCYYSIYIDETTDYNSLPTNDGKYHIKTMMYDPITRTLTIEEFLYEYQN